MTIIPQSEIDGAIRDACIEMYGKKNYGKYVFSKLLTSYILSIFPQPNFEKGGIKFNQNEIEL